MKDCLVLLTNYYPFFKGEEYLESEIHYLANKFKKVYVISTMVSKNMEQTREVPDNIIVIPSNLEHSKLGKLKMILKKVNIIMKDKNKKQLIKDDSKGRMKRKLYCTYFECRSLEVYEQIIKKLDEYNLKENNSIVIYSYWLYVTSRVAIELKNNYFKSKKVKIVTRAHRYDLYEDEAPMKYLPQREFLLKGLDHIYPCSEDGVDFIVNKYPAYKDKILVKRLGTISKNEDVKVSNNTLHIVSCSAVRKVKRIELIIDALKELNCKGIKYKWTHIGDGEEFNKVKDYAEKYLENGNYEFKGFMKNDTVLNWYKNNTISVFINVSSSEGVPVSIMEAMSKKIPIIATDVGGTREIVINNKNGYLIPKDFSISILVDKFLLINNMSIERYLKMSDTSYEIWKEKCNAEILYENFSEEL